MFTLLDDAERTRPMVRTVWMKLSRLATPPGRHVALAPGVLLFHPYRVNPVSVLDVGADIPVPLVEPVSRDLEAPAWHEWSLCNGMDQELFFSEDRQKRVTLAKQAKVICRACPVAAACLTWALEQQEEFGIWAATSGRRRASMQERILAGDSTVEQEVAAWLNPPQVA